MARPRSKEYIMGIAEIHKKRRQLLVRAIRFKTWYYFIHRGANGEIIATGETYTQKHNVVEVLKKYYPNFEVKDVTDE